MAAWDLLESQVRRIVVWKKRKGSGEQAKGNEIKRRSTILSENGSGIPWSGHARGGRPKRNGEKSFLLYNTNLKSKMGKNGRKRGGSMTVRRLIFVCRLNDPTQETFFKRLNRKFLPTERETLCLKKNP